MKNFSLSFEFFPPKTTQGTQQLCETALTLAECRPEFFSVTFGAGGSTQEGTIEAVKLLRQKTRLVVAPHLSCIGASQLEILTLLHTYKNMGVRRMLALRGDIPSGMVQTGDFQFAYELVKLIREQFGNYFYLIVAAYPEFHPQALSVEDDILNLKRKQEAGANAAITQYFFNADSYFIYLDDCRAQGITMPIIPGVMPITQFAKLARFSDHCGAEIPRWIRKRLESYQDDTQSIREFGAEVVYDLCERLMMGGAPGIHFYTLNKAEAAMEIVTMLGLISLKEREKLVI